MSDKKMEIVYYKLCEMEDRLTEKGEAILRARDELESSINRLEALLKGLLRKLETDEGMRR